MVNEYTKSNTGKLLAAIIAMLMVVCAVAVVAMPADAEGTPTAADTSINYGDTVEITQDAWDAMETTAIAGTQYVDANKVVKLTANSTWNLKENITSDISIDLNGFNLKITGDFSLTVTNNAADDNGNCISALDNNGASNAALMIDGSTVTFIGNGTRAGGVWAVDADKLSQVYLVNGAILNAQKTETSAVTGTVWHGAGGVTTVFVDASTIKFTNAHSNGSGVASTAIFAYNNSTVDATGLAGGSMSVYADIKDSKLNANVLGLYAANISGNSTVTANTLGVYSGAADAGWNGFTTNQVSVGTGSSVTAETIVNSLTAGTPAGTDSVVFTGAGSVSGSFTEISETESSYTLSGITLTGTSSVADGVNVTVPTGSTVTVPADATFTVSSGATLYNGGTVNATNGTFTLEGKMIASPTSTTAGVEWSAIKNNVTVYNGATIQNKSGTSVIPTDHKYAESQEVTTFPELVNAINAGIERITVPASSESPMIISSDLEIPYGTSIIFGSATATAAVQYDDSKTILTVAQGTTYTIAGDVEVYGGVVVEAGATLIVETELTANSIYVQGTMENSGIVNITGMMDVETTGTVENSGDMYLGAASNVDGTFENSGAVGVYQNAANIDITGNGTFNNATGGVVGFPVNTKVVTGVSYDVTMTTDITQSTTFGSLQNVIVPEGATLTVQRTATLEINGTLTVLGTLNVEGQLVIKSAAGAQLVIDGTVNVTTTGNNQGKIVIGDGTEYGYATVNGTLNVTDGSAVEIKAATVDGDVFGALVVNGILNLQAGTTISSNVTAPAAEQPEIGKKPAIPAQGIVVSADTTVQINGDLVGIVAIRNYGNITVDNSASTLGENETPGSLSVLMGSADASVTLTTFKLAANGANSFSVSDSGLIFKDRTRDETAAGNAITVTDVNTVEFKAGSEPVVLNGGVVFTESVTSKTTNSTTTYTNKLNIEGSVSAAFTDRNSTENVTTEECVDMNVTGNKAVTVTGSLTLGANVEMNNAENLEVSGTVINTATGAQIIQNTGEITVTGLITASKEIAGTGVINAAKYTITSGTPAVTTYNYSTLEAAVPAVADATNTATKTILVMGEITVEQDLDVPAGITINHAKDAKLTIDRDATVTMQAGSKMTSAKEQVVVDGTLTFNDKTNDATTKTVSDVTVEDEAKNGYRTYTNIYSALAEATDGQTVTVTKDTGLVVIDENLTVPAGVTLVVPSRAVSLYLEDGVTLTVDGTLKTDLAIFAEHTFGTTATNVEAATGVTAKQSSAIVVNGTLQVAEEIGFAYGNNTAEPAVIVDTITGVSIADDAPVYGAYYSVDGYTVVSTLAIASGNADIVGAVVVNGPVNAGDVTFTGTDEFTGIVIGNNATVEDMNGKDVVTVLTVGSLTLVGTDVATTYGALNGDVVVGDARLTVSNVKNLTVTDDEEDGMVVSGNVSVIGDNGGKVTLAAGTATATLNSSANTVEFDVAAGATLVSDGANLYKLTVDGTVSVASGKNLTAATVVVEGNGTLSVTASTATSAAGSAQITNLFLGIDKGDYKIADNVTGDLDTAAEGTATVSGPVSGINNAYVLNGAVIDESNLEGMDSTAFNVNGQVWFTAYVSAASGVEDITVDKAPVENAVLAGWSETADGEAETVTEGNKTVAKTEFAIGEAENLYAVIEYEIYHIVLKANEAVDDVFINGNLMSKGLVMDSTGMYYAYTMDIAAGSYTVSYTLANGYSGEGVLAVNGTAQSGLTFSVSGTPAIGQSYITYNMELSGFEKTGYVPESPDTGSDDSGMGITDYLLIVLVVLIVVMAIIVAMRLMRS